MPSRNILQANPMSAPRAMTDRSKTPAEPTTAQRPKRAPNAKPNAKPAKNAADAKPAKKPKPLPAPGLRLPLKNSTPNQPHTPTDETRELARKLSGYGIPQQQIALLLGISKPTLHDHYRDDLDIGMADANSKIAGTLFLQAMNGNTAAAIFWSKARMGWSEKQDITISGGEKPLEVSVQSQLVEKLVAAIESRRANRKPDA
jgi:hypothetical protein